MNDQLLLYKVNNKIFITDKLVSKNYNRVFPIYEDESIFFAENLKVNKNDIVLDLGCGSGILSVFSASKAKKVYAIDINERALQFTKFNACLNSVDIKIKAIKSNLFEKIKGKFDVILFNPPFNISPGSLKGALFSDGGLDGLKITKKALKDINNFINKGARLQLITLSLGKFGKPIIIDEIYKYLGKNISIEYTELYPKTKSLHFLKGVFGNKYKDFITDIANKYPEYYYLFITVYFNPKNKFLRKLKTPHFKMTNFSGSWKARINRRRAILGYRYK